MDNDIQIHSRLDYVLVWINNDMLDINRGYCSLCRVPDKGEHCPGTTNCVKDINSSNCFDNTKHIIIATKDFCNGKQYYCLMHCPTCTLTNTYESLKVIK